MQATLGEASISEEQKRNDPLPANLYDPDPQVWKNNRGVFVNTHGELKAKLSGPIRSALISLPGEEAILMRSADSFEKNGVRYLVLKFYSSDGGIDFKKEYKATASTYNAAAKVYEVTLPVAELLKASLDPRVEEVGHKIMLRPDLARSTSSKNFATTELVANCGIKGDGVIIGILDGGIDVDHPEFKVLPGHRDYTSGATTKILKVYSYGQSDTLASTWTRSSVGIPKPIVAPGKFAHGTFVSSIAAGNTGVAPGANIIFADIEDLDAIPDAIARMKNDAAALGMELVVNMSIGSSSGAREQGAKLESALNGAAASNVILVKSAGNDADENRHAEIAVPKASSAANPGTALVHFAVDQPSGAPSYVRAGGSSIAYFRGDISKIQVAILDEDNRPLGFWREAPQSALESAFGDLKLVNSPKIGGMFSILVNAGHEGTSESLSIVVVDTDGQAGTQVFPGGIFKLAIANHDTNNPVLVDAYSVSSFDLDSPVYFLDSISTQKTISSGSAANNVITVGAYESQKLTSLFGLDFTSQGSGETTVFSGEGPSRDEVPLEKPDFVAPGSKIRAARAAGGDAKLGGNSEYTFAEGTSFSAPHVAGLTALFFEAEKRANPNFAQSAFDVDKIRSIFRASMGASASHDNKSGYGKLSGEKLFTHRYGQMCPPSPENERVFLKNIDGFAPSRVLVKGRKKVTKGSEQKVIEYSWQDDRTPEGLLSSRTLVKTIDRIVQPAVTYQDHRFVFEFSAKVKDVNLVLETSPVPYAFVSEPTMLLGSGNRVLLTKLNADALGYATRFEGRLTFCGNSSSLAAFVLGSAVAYKGQIDFDPSTSGIENKQPIGKIQIKTSLQASNVTHLKVSSEDEYEAGWLVLDDLASAAFETARQGAVEPGSHSIEVVVDIPLEELRAEIVQQGSNEPLLNLSLVSSDGQTWQQAFVLDSAQVKQEGQYSVRLIGKDETGRGLLMVDDAKELLNFDPDTHYKGDNLGANTRYKLQIRKPFESEQEPNVLSEDIEVGGPSFSLINPFGNISTDFKFPNVNIGGNVFDPKNLNFAGLPQGFKPDAVAVPDYQLGVAKFFNSLGMDGIDVDVCPIPSKKSGLSPEQQVGAIADATNATANNTPGAAGRSVRAAAVGEDGIALMATQAQGYASAASSQTAKLRNVVMNSVPFGQNIPGMKVAEAAMASYEIVAQVYAGAMGILAGADAGTGNAAGFADKSLKAFGYLQEAGLDYINCQANELADFATSNMDKVNLGGYARQKRKQIDASLGACAGGFNTSTPGNCDVVNNLKDKFGVADAINDFNTMQSAAQTLQNPGASFGQDLQQISSIGSSMGSGFTLESADKLIRPVLNELSKLPGGFLVQAGGYLNSVLSAGQGNGLASLADMDLGSLGSSFQGAGGKFKDIKVDGLKPNLTTLGALAPALPFLTNTQGLSGMGFGSRAGADPTATLAAMNPAGAAGCLLSAHRGRSSVSRATVPP
jgi:subtilisin family serine protease